ncbi:MAG: DUF1269 domain-containing protein [Gammaproteobacteria bacterium]
MRRRLYFLLPTVDSARKVHNELLLSRIEERHMHVVARDDVDLDDLPEAGLLQKTDLVHSIQIGLMLGGAAGIVLGGLAGVMGYLVSGLEGLAMLGTGLGGAVIGAFTSSMIGVSVPNTKHKEFQQHIDKGGLLFLVEVPVEQVDEVSEKIRQHYPEATVRGIEPTIPAFP